MGVRIVLAVVLHPWTTLQITMNFLEASLTWKAVKLFALVGLDASVSSFTVEAVVKSGRALKAFVLRQEYPATYACVTRPCLRSCKVQSYEVAKKPEHINMHWMSQEMPLSKGILHCPRDSRQRQATCVSNRQETVKKMREHAKLHCQ